MARRAQRRRDGLHVPRLEAGLRAKAAGFAPRVRLPVLDALDHGAPFLIGGASVWAGLYQVAPAEADAFRRRCGWRPGIFAAWEAVDNTLWTFDPRTATLRPATDKE